MKRTICYLLAAGCAFLVGAQWNSFAQAQKTPRESIQGLKEANAKLVEQQNATLEKLDEMAKQVAQLRAFSKR